jgi:ATP-dependent Clp protease ATP-binding subunit ClpA
MTDYTKGYFLVMQTAERLKEKFNLTYVGTELILYAILNTPKCDACAYLNEFGATKENYFAPLKKTLKERPVIGYTVKAINAQNEAVEFARLNKLSYVSTEHLLLAILSIKDCRAMSILRSLGVDISALFAFIWERIKVNAKPIQSNSQPKPNQINKPTEIIKQNTLNGVDIYKYEYIDVPVHCGQVDVNKILTEYIEYMKGLNG